MLKGNRLSKFSKSSSDKGEGLWLMSFSDMSLILLSFFALMLSVSKIDKQKFDNVQDGMSSKKIPDKKEEKNLAEISTQISQAIAAKNISKDARVVLDAEGLGIEFSDRLVFQSGSASPHPEFVAITDQVMKVIAESPDKYSIKIEGHTDDVPIRGGIAFKDNWELSSARAMALLDQFKRRGVDERRMSLCAYAHTRPKNDLKNLSGQALEAARSINRRVVIRLE